VEEEVGIQRRSSACSQQPPTKLPSARTPFTKSSSTKLVDIPCSQGLTLIHFSAQRKRFL